MNDADGQPLKTPLRPLLHFFRIFSLAIVLPSISLGLILAWWSAYSLVERQEQEAVRVALAVSESMGNHVNTLFTGLALLSQLPLGEDQFPDFYQVAKRFSEIEGYNVTLADGDGNQFLSTRLPLGATLPHRDAMDSVRKAIASGKGHVSEIFPGRMTGNYVVTVDAPVSTKDGLRIITLSTSATSIAKVASRTPLPEGWLMALIDEHGVFISRSKDPDQWVGKPTRPELVDASRRSVSGKIYNKSVEGIPILNVFNRVPGTDWTVLIGVPESVLYAPVIRPVGLMAGLIVLTITLTVLLAFGFYLRLKAATARLLAIASDPMRSDDGAPARISFAEFEVVAKTLEIVAGSQQELMADLSQSKERYHSLFKSIDEGFCLIELIYDEHENPIDFRFVEVNPAFEKQNGLVGATGNRISDLAPDLEPVWLKTYGEVARTGESIRFQNQSTATGARWFDVYVFRIGAPGSYLVSILFKDISESKRLEQNLRSRNVDLEKAKAVAEEASLAKSNFLANMSHELRTPLNAILGFAQLLESSLPPPPPSEKSKIDQILTAGWYLLELINEILDLAQIESGKVAMSREAVSLQHVLSECHALVDPLANKRGIEVSLTPLDRPHYVDADRTRLKQVLINLLHNAVKYNKPAGTVTVECDLTPANSIRINVRDTGLGLSPEQVDQLFQPFNRLGMEAGPEQGTGIGLVVVKRLIELMGGSVGVDSHVGVGSVFWIELNLTAAPLPKINEADQAVRANPMPTKGAQDRTVLYVEDNPANLALMEELIARRPDLRLISAANGNLGVEYARTYLPEIILIDLHLPGISGIEAMKILRADPQTAHIPVIAVSAYALEADIELALDAGCFNYITKPIQLNEFMIALDVALKFSQRESARAANKA
jgi:signal transduction histidine kinase/CheY-like chemotaxis protein